MKEVISKLSYDGRQLITRIPKIIETEHNLIKGQRLSWVSSKDKIILRGLHRTDIEQIMFDALTKEDIEFVEQFPIRGKYGYIADFLLPESNIIIECDGEQWHEKLRDNKRDAILRKAGYKILRFTGTEIRTNIQTCLTKIRQKIKLGGVLSGGLE